MTQYKSLAISITLAAVMAGSSGLAQNFEGPSAMVYGGVISGASLGGFKFGYDIETENLVYGAAFDIGYTPNSNSTLMFLSGRAGYKLGDGFMAFGSAGYGQILGLDAWEAGAGFEAMISNTLSIRGEYARTIPANGNVGVSSMKFGVAWRY